MKARALQGLLWGVLDGDLIGYELSLAACGPVGWQGSVAAERERLHTDSMCRNVFAIALRFIANISEVASVTRVVVPAAAPPMPLSSALKNTSAWIGVALVVFAINILRHHLQ